MWEPYIKPTNKLYDGFWGENGFNNMEVGYLKLGKNKKVIDHIVLSKSCDSIIFDTIFNAPKAIGIDCVGNNMIRLMDCGNPLRWRGDMVLSTGIVEVGEPFNSFKDMIHTNPKKEQDK